MCYSALLTLEYLLCFDDSECNFIYCHLLLHCGWIRYYIFDACFGWVLIFLDYSLFNKRLSVRLHIFTYLPIRLLHWLDWVWLFCSWCITCLISFVTSQMWAGIWIIFFGYICFLWVIFLFLCITVFLFLSIWLHHDLLNSYFYMGLGFWEWHSKLLVGLEKNSFKIKI